MYRSVLTFVLAGASMALPVCARESVCLKSGFCMTADSHLQKGNVVVLHSGSGTTELPADQIAQIVLLADPPEAPKAAQSSALAPANGNDDVNELLIKAAIAQGLEPEFVRSVARIESNLRQDAISNKGAIGTMQLMPGTAALLGVNANVTEQNILGGAIFLRQLLLRYNGDPALALAAYNAGPGAVQKYNGVPPYMETRKYIIKVLEEYKRLQAQAKKN